MNYLKLALITLMIINIPACCLGPCGCGVEPRQFTFKEMLIETGELVSKYNFIPITSELEIEKFAFMIRGRSFEYATFDKPASFSFINQAKACSPAPPDAGHKLSSLSITANGVLYFNNEKLDSGAVLNDLFVDENKIIIDQLITDEALFEYDDGMYYFQFKNKPDSAIYESFNFNIEFDDGATFLLESRIIAITN